MQPTPRTLAAIAVSTAVFGLALSPKPADARRQRKSPKRARAKAEVIRVPVQGATRVTVAGLRRVSVASDIADVEAYPPDEILITGKRLGTTTVTVYRDRGAVTYQVVVGYPRDRIEQLLREALPSLRELSLEDAGSSLVVRGQVESVSDVERAEEIIRGFLPAPSRLEAPPAIVNLLRVTGEQQVQLEVAFAEVSRSALKQVGVNLWHRGSRVAGGLFNPQTTPTELGGADGSGLVGEIAPPTDANAPVVLPPVVGAFSAIFGLGNNHEFPFAAALSVLANRGYARTLAEPTLVALSGRKATFLAGGEFPLPLPQALGQVTVEFKKFGVQLEFTPTVVDDTIQLAVDMIVSDLDFSLGIKLSNVTVPGLTKRQSATTVRLKDGQSFAIAGLLSDKVRSNIDKVPWLGDLPILGALFRSTRYQRDETELLVVVTARLVSPLNQRPELPGELDTTDPSDLELFFLGTYESKKTPGKVPGAGLPGAPQGPVGFQR